MIGLAILGVFVAGLVIGSVLSRRKPAPVDGARFGATVAYMYGQRRAPGALEMAPMTERPRAPR